MSAVRPRPPALDYALLLLLATLWGSSYALIKLGVATIPPVTFIAARTAIAGALLYGLMRLRQVPLPTDRRSLRLFAFQALMNSVFPFTLIAWAETVVDAGLATILSSTTPIFVFLISWGVLGHERATRGRVFGVATGVAGIVLIIGVDALDGLGRDILAQLALVVATVCYAVAAIFGRTFRGLDPIVPAAGSMLAGAAIMVPLSLIVDRPWSLTPSTGSLLALAALAVGSTALGFILYFRLLASLGPVGTTSQAYLRVPIGVAIGVVFLGETLGSTALLGLAFVVAGVVAMTRPARP